MEQLKSQLIELEKGFWKAAGSDGSYYKQHFADKGTLVLPFVGGILNKPQAIETVKQSQAWISSEIKYSQLIEITPSSAILLYEVAARRDKDDIYQAYISSLYCKYNDSWKLFFHQQTPFS